MSNHSFIRVICVVSDVQQLRVLQLLTDSLEETEGLVEWHGHGDSGQVLADVVVQDGHDTDVAVVCAVGRQDSAAA